MPGLPSSVALFPALPLRARPKRRQGCAPRGQPGSNERDPLTPHLSELEEEGPTEEREVVRQTVTAGGAGGGGGREEGL